MRAAGTPFESQARLWVVAFVASMLITPLALVAIGLAIIASHPLRPAVPRTPQPMESVALILPHMLEKLPAGEAPAEPAAKAPSFARTSPDQAEAIPEVPDFIGERNTRATSDSPVTDADRLTPAQQGREPRWEDEIETTESDYQDGELANDRPAPPDAPPMPPETARPEATEAAELAAVDEPADVPAERENSPPEDRLAEGPILVERKVKERVPEESPKPTPSERMAEGEEKVAEEERAAKQPKPAVSPETPGFRGNQQKTRLVGSLSRVGRSALNVEDSALGRYHAAVSRAVEKEWQRNCVRNRDFIVPGQLTLSFVLDASGNVRSSFFIEELGVGNIQKGFTLNSIRDAEIPAMPGELKNQLDGESLELIYRFNF